MNFSRTFAISANVFRAVIRDQVFYLVGLFTTLFILAAALIPDIAAGTGDKIILDVGLAAISLINLLTIVFIGTGLVNQEIDKKTVLTLIAKPVSRSEVIFGKYLGLSAVILIMLLLMTAIYFGVLEVNQIPYPSSSILIALLFLFFELSLIIAVAILFGVFTSSLLAALLTIATYLMGHFTRDLVKLGEISESPQIQRITSGLYLLLPDLARLDLKNQAIYGMQLIPAPLELLSNFAYGLAYTVLLLIIATFIFWRREF